MFEQSQAYSGFAVKDIPEAKAFYGETLGFKVDEQYDGGLLDVQVPGGNHVLIYQKDDFVPATYTILNFPVPDVDGAVDDLVRAGVEMARFDGFDQDAKGIARGQGPTIAWFRDPAGNILAVHSNEPM